MAILSPLSGIHQKQVVFRYSFHKTYLRYQLGLIYLCFICVLKAAWCGLAVPVIVRNQFLITCIVKVDLLLTVFVAGDKRYNLRRIVTSEKSLLSSLENCFLYLIIPGMIFYHIR